MAQQKTLDPIMNGSSEFEGLCRAVSNHKAVTSACAALHNASLFFRCRNALSPMSNK